MSANEREHVNVYMYVCVRKIERGRERGKRAKERKRAERMWRVEDQVEGEKGEQGRGRRRERMRVLDLTSAAMSLSYCPKAESCRTLLTKWPTQIGKTILSSCKFQILGRRRRPLFLWPTRLENTSAQLQMCFRNFSPSF